MAPLVSIVVEGECEQGIKGKMFTQQEGPFYTGKFNYNVGVRRVVGWYSSKLNAVRGAKQATFWNCYASVLLLVYTRCCNCFIKFHHNGVTRLGRNMCIRLECDAILFTIIECHWQLSALNTIPLQRRWPQTTPNRPTTGTGLANADRVLSIRNRSLQRAFPKKIEIWRETRNS
jgi:hypothetical protein